MYVCPVYFHIRTEFVCLLNDTGTMLKQNIYASSVPLTTY